MLTIGIVCNSPCELSIARLGVVERCVTLDAHHLHMRNAANEAILVYVCVFTSSESL